MGVINPLDPTVETAEHVKSDLVTAAKYIPKESLGATDDCGFSPFSRDIKPKHGSPDFARDVAMQKIRAPLEGARPASEELGLGVDQRSVTTKRERVTPEPSLLAPATIAPKASR
jgi:hypothetical protein